jgi:flagellar biosynthesis protein FliQ
MSTDIVAQLFREGMVLLGVVGGPLIGALLVVGLVVGVLQSATQIQEPAVGAVPRILTVLGVSVAIGPWMVERLARFLHYAMERLGDRTF